MNFAAPAKLNLSLRVRGRRGDGFHEIETLMVRLRGLEDCLTVERAAADEFFCQPPVGGLPQENLVMRALSLFRQRTGCRAKWRVTLKKQVPHGAGLGGGSSNAAAMLRALEELCETGLEPAELREMAAELGSDVPFFLGPPTALMRGRGELVAESAPLPALPVLLLKPAFAVATAWAYQGWRNAVEIPGVRYAPQAMPWGELVNDLERPVFMKHRFLAEVKEWLRNQPGVAGAAMSGSGSTMFAILADPAMAPSLTAAARRELDPSLWAWSGWTEEGQSGAGNDADPSDDLQS